LIGCFFAKWQKTYKNHKQFDIVINIVEEDEVQQQKRELDEKTTAERAAILGIKYLDTREIEKAIPLASGVINIEIMHKNRLVPLVGGNEGQAWQIGITTQTPQSFISDLTKQYNNVGHTIQFLLISDSGYRVIMDRYDPVIKAVHDDIKIAKEGDSNTISEVSKTLNSVGSDEIFDYLITQADQLSASDIHIENQRTHMRIRMRIDGVLHPVADLENDRYRVILSTLASLANISTASTEPQSGHMQKEITKNGEKYILNIRVETVPTIYGQDAVLRLFNFDESMLNLDRLSIAKTERAQIDDIISHPRGMVLMVGPTGSGKSTTLYSIINALNTTTRKIITLEDPIEYGITGITQIPIDTIGGHSFADGLRAVLRLDPDVVMVGEIRDADTAKTAIQASITGHLVLSSFHANSTSAAFSRMIDMIGVNPIFSSSIRLVIAQRLVRRLDDATKEEYDPDDATKKWVQETLKDLPSHVEKPELTSFKLWRPVVSEASPFGFSGRIVIMEQMVVGESIQRFLRGDEADIHTEIIENAARKSGMVTLLEQGVLAALRGETTLDEINRAI
jgi:type IV pilus assembly protein PilB